MKTNTRNVLAVMIQGVVALLFFLPGMYTREVYNASFLGVKIIERRSCSLIDRTNFDSNWLGWALLICMLVGVVIYIIQVIAGNKMKLMILPAIIAPTELVAFVLFSVLYNGNRVYNGNEYMYSYSYVREFLFLVTTALLIALALISITGYVRGAKQRKACAASKEETGKADADDITRSGLRCQYKKDRLSAVFLIPFYSFPGKLGMVAKPRCRSSSVGMTSRISPSLYLP